MTTTSVHATAAADANDHLRRAVCRSTHAVHDGVGRQVGLCPVVDGDRQTVSPQVGDHCMEVGIRTQASIGADQHALAELRSHRADRVALSGTEQDGAGQPHGAKQAHNSHFTGSSCPPGG